MAGDITSGRCIGIIATHCRAESRRLDEICPSQLDAVDSCADLSVHQMDRQKSRACAQPLEGQQLDLLGCLEQQELVPDAIGAQPAAAKISP